MLSSWLTCAATCSRAVAVRGVSESTISPERMNLGALAKSFSRRLVTEVALWKVSMTRQRWLRKRWLSESVQSWRFMIVFVEGAWSLR